MPPLGRIHERILEVLRRHPDGVTAGEIRAELGLNPDEQSQLDRRRRDLYPYFIIDTVRNGRTLRYVLRGSRDRAQVPDADVSARVRALILHEAAGRCGMCGRTIAQHGIALVVDHRVPRGWGGTNDVSNLWAICEECNGGKKNLFESLDAEEMKSVLRHESVHVRLGEFLKLNASRPVTPWLLHFVSGGQDDWKKRVRELRYLGWEIEVQRRVTEHGRVMASYVLTKWTPWPDAPTEWIRRYEMDRARRNRGSD